MQAEAADAIENLRSNSQFPMAPSNCRPKTEQNTLFQQCKLSQKRKKPYKSSLLAPNKKRGPSQRGQVLSVYIKKGVLVIILPREHYGIITEIFHLCNKYENVSMP
jgi:hypothetical protein